MRGRLKRRGPTSAIRLGIVCKILRLGAGRDDVGWLAVMVTSMVILLVMLGTTVIVIAMATVIDMGIVGGCWC